MRALCHLMILLLRGEIKQPENFILFYDRVDGYFAENLFDLFDTEKVYYLE